MKKVNDEYVDKRNSNLGENEREMFEVYVNKRFMYEKKGSKIIPVKPSCGTLKRSRKRRQNIQFTTSNLKLYKIFLKV